MTSFVATVALSEACISRNLYGVIASSEVAMALASSHSRSIVIKDRSTMKSICGKAIKTF